MVHYLSTRNVFTYTKYASNFLKKKKKKKMITASHIIARRHQMTMNEAFNVIRSVTIFLL